MASILYTPFQIKKASPSLRKEREILLPRARSFRIFSEEILFYDDDSFYFLEKNEKESKRIELPGVRAVSQAGVLSFHDDELYFYQPFLSIKEKVASEGLPLQEMLLFPSFSDDYQRDSTIYALTKDGRVFMNILHGSPWSEVILDTERHLGSLAGDEGILFFLERSAYLITERNYWQKIDDVSSDMLTSEKFCLLSGEPFFFQDHTLFDKGGEVYKENLRDALAFDDLLLLHFLDGSLSLLREEREIASFASEEKIEGLALSGDKLLLAHEEDREGLLRARVYRIP